MNPVSVCTGCPCKVNEELTVNHSDARLLQPDQFIHRDEGGEEWVG